MHHRALLACALSLSLAACSPTAGPGGGTGTGRDTDPAPAMADGGGGPTASGDDAGMAAPPARDAGAPASGERCGDGFDDDGDGAIDEGCSCTAGESQRCHTDRTVAGVGACVFGEQTCEGTEEFGSFGECVGAIGPAEETCENGVDDDCDGMVDEDCPTIVEVDVDLDGDCLTASCPAEAPYPVGCSIHMEGGDPRGCVASTPTGSTVYFQEGDVCGAGHVSGTLSCSSEVGDGLNETNCVIDKPTRYYPRDRSGCPDT